MSWAFIVKGKIRNSRLVSAAIVIVGIICEFFQTFLNISMTPVITKVP